MKKTLYISDLDGTLLNSKAELSDKSAELLNAAVAGGIDFSFATARTAASSLKIMAGVNINVPVVLMNGVSVYDIPSGRYLKNEYISTDISSRIISLMKKNVIHGFMYKISGDEQLTTFYEELDTEALRAFYSERCEKYYKSFEKVGDFSSAADDKVVYFTMLDARERLQPVYEAAQAVIGLKCAYYKDIYSENLWYLELFSNKASKYNAVKYLRDTLGYDRVVGFGDNLNDIPLFEACDECYAVANARDELKKMADGIIGTNESNSAAEFIFSRMSADKVL